MTHSTLSLNTTGKVRLEGLQDNNGAVQNDATVTMTALVDRDTGDAITGVTLPLTMDHVGGSSGDYEATVPAGISVTHGQWLLATVRAVGSQGFQKEWEETVRVLKAVT